MGGGAAPADFTPERGDRLRRGRFYALALIGTTPPTDLTHANQKRAAAILDPIYRRQPDHVGIAHYLIHARQLGARNAPPSRRSGLRENRAGGAARAAHPFAYLHAPRPLG